MGNDKSGSSPPSGSSPMGSPRTKASLRQYSLRRESTVGFLKAHQGGAGNAARHFSLASNTLGLDMYNSQDTESSWADTVLSPARWVYKTLFADLREEDDDFDTILRKIVVSAGVPLVIFPVAFAVYLAAEISGTGITVGGIVTLFVMMVFPLVWIPTFLYVKYTRQVSDLLIDLWLITTTLGVLVIALSLIEYPVPQLAFFLLVMSMLCRTPRLPLHVLLCSVVYAIAMMNQALAGLNENTNAKLATFPEPYRGSILERIAYQVTCLIIGGIIASAVIMQSRENARMMASAATASTVARNVANHLATYDTDTAKQILADFAQEDADPDLVFAFYAIVENLEMYRPHLPNWIMQAHDEERALLLKSSERKQAPDPFNFAGRQVLSPTSEDLDVSTSAGKARRLRRHRDKMASRDLDLEMDIRVESVSNSPDDESLTPPQVSITPQRRMSLNGRLQGGTPSGSHNPRTPVVSALLSAAGQKPYLGKATFALVHIDLKLSVTDMMTQSFDPIMEHVCDRLHDVASNTHAAIHAIVGDTVFMSWNAVQRSAAHEVKAAKAFAQLAYWSGHASATVAGVAMTDTIRCHHYGQKQKLFGAHLPFRNAMWAVAMYAREREALLVDEHSYRSASAEVEMFPADILIVENWRRSGGGVESTMASPKNAATKRVTSNGAFGASLGPSSPGLNLNNSISNLASSASFSDLIYRQFNIYEVVREHGTHDAFSAEPGMTISEEIMLGATPSRHNPPPGSQQHNGHGDEWMYQVQRRSRGGCNDSANGDSTDPIEQCLQTALQGRYVEALESLTEFVRGPLSSKPSFERAATDGAVNLDGDGGLTIHLPTEGGDVSTVPHIPSPQSSNSLHGAARPVRRLQNRLEHLIATRAGPEEFPTVCVLSYSPSIPHSKLMTAPPSRKLSMRAPSFLCMTPPETGHQQ
jgi:hypothetical protein